MERDRQGVLFRRHHQPLETVTTKHHDIQLLARGDGTEIMRYVLQPGGRFMLGPEEGWEALEFFTVLQGDLRWLRPDGDLLLGPGDHVSGAPVGQDCNFLAETEVVLLYACSRPVFNRYSEECRRMREMAEAVEQKDGYTADHCQRIQDLCARVGQRLHLSPGQMDRLLNGAYLHDIGKVAVPPEILGKPAKLTAVEWAIMKQHPILGANMVADSHLRDVAAVIAQHHERWDGSGYPVGLRGEAICLEARIVAVVDSYDAMTTDRPYQKGRTWQEAAAELRRGRGAHYDPEVLDIFLNILDESSGTV